MPNLVTMDEARAQLRISNYGTNGSPDDLWLETWIPAVSEAVALWLKDGWRLYQWELDSNGDPVMDSNDDPIVVLNTNGDPVVRNVVRAAVLVELSSQYRFREGEGDNVVPSDAGHGYVLNKASTALLAPLRRPTMAYGATGIDGSLEGRWRPGFRGCCT